jgi:galactokinase
MNHSEMHDRFAARFGARCQVVARAPGRVNLIGEHTDYNDGFVLPIATAQETWVAAGARRDDSIRVYSTELDDEQTWRVGDWHAAAYPHWTSYVAGVASLLGERGAAPAGCDVLIRSDVPPGGGLSSSAALEIATALALARLGRQQLADRELIDLCRRAEHEFAGVPCGLMDQSVSVCAQADTAFLLDCRSRECQHIPCDLDPYVLVVIDSGARHELVAGEYARRQEECRRAVDYFRQRDPAVASLRDVSIENIRTQAAHMEPVVAARVRHVVSENERTVAATEALRKGDIGQFGRLMSESHRSLRDDYEVSCPELDELVRIVSAVPGVLGARMTGGGFGGCVVTIALETSVALIEAAIRTESQAGAAKRATVLRTRANRGASVESC